MTSPTPQVRWFEVVVRKSSESNMHYDEEKAVSDRQTGDRVFPATDSITGASPIDDFKEEWYSQHLIAMGEPLLPDGANEVYRFLWLRTFHNPIMIRLTYDPKGCDLIAKRLDGAGGNRC